MDVEFTKYNQKLNYIGNVAIHLRFVVLFTSCCHLAAALGNYIRRAPADSVLYPGQGTVKAATMEAAAGMSNMLQFMKLIGQLKVRLLPHTPATFLFIWSLSKK